MNRIGQTIRSLGEDWNRFWFTPISAESLGLMRLLSGGMLFYTHLVWGLDLQAFLGKDGWNGTALLQTLQEKSVPSAFFSFWWWIPEQHALTVHIVSLVILGLYTVGCLTRLTASLSLVITVSYAHRAMLANYGLDQINSVLMFYLAISRCGDAYSLDRLWGRYRRARSSLIQGTIPLPETSPLSTANGLATRLLQLHYCVIYFFAGISKLQGESWWAGEALWRAASNYEYQSGDLTWLAWCPWLVNLATHGTVFWEISFCFLVWKRPLRPMMLWCGVLMHLGIGAFFGMWTFGLAMIFGYLCWVPPASTRRWLQMPLGWIASREQCLQVKVGQSRQIRRAARVKTWDFFDRVALVLVRVGEQERGHVRMSHSGGVETQVDRSQLRSCLAPLVVVCSQDSAANLSRLLDYFSKYGMTCALTRDIVDARDLAAYHGERACVLWLVSQMSSLQEICGQRSMEWQHEMVSMVVQIPLTDLNALARTCQLPDNANTVIVLGQEVTYRILRTAIEELLDRNCSQEHGDSQEQYANSAEENGRERRPRVRSAQESRP